jgi:hypothetical protein
VRELPPRYDEVNWEEGDEPRESEPRGSERRA